MPKGNVIGTIDKTVILGGNKIDVFVDDKPELLLEWIIEQLSNPTAPN